MRSLACAERLERKGNKYYGIKLKDGNVSEKSHSNRYRQEFKLSEIRREDLAMLAIIKKIVASGNDAEIKDKGDGRLAVYEVKKSRIDRNLLE